MNSSILGSYHPQLPSWVFGNPLDGAGTFSTDTAQPSDTTQIVMNVVTGGVDLTNPLAAIVTGSLLLLTSASGVTSSFLLQSIALSPPYLTFGVVSYGGSPNAWSGLYTLSLFPAVQTAAQVGAATSAQGALADSAIQPGNAGLIVADTGWTANADGGDKTAVIGSTATLDTIATALNIVTAGAGTQLENIAQKVKALETALANSLRPSA